LANPLDLAQQILPFAPRRAGAQQAGECALGLLDAPYQPGDVRREFLAHDRRGHGQALAFHHQHPDQLAAAAQHRLQRAGLLILQWAPCRPDGLREERHQRRRIDPIGPGQPRTGFGEVTHLARIDPDDRQPGGGELGDQRRLLAAGRLEHAALDR